MAASDEAICSLALGHLGDPGTVSDVTTTPTSKQEIICNRWYDTARQRVLLSKTVRWDFAKRYALLVIHDSTDDDADLIGEWCFAYNAPSDFLQILAIVPEGAPKFRAAENIMSEDFELYTEADDTTLILTNLGSGDDADSEAYALYIENVTDTTRFSDEFTYALSYLLASLIAGPLIGGQKGVTLAAQMRELYRITLNEVAASAGNQRQISEEYKNHKPTGILSGR